MLRTGFDGWWCALYDGNKKAPAQNDAGSARKQGAS